MRSPSSSHSMTDPGPTPSLRRTSAGTEICPCAVSFDCAMIMFINYLGNVCGSRTLSELQRLGDVVFADRVGGVEVGDRAGDAEDAIVGAGAERETIGGAGEERESCGGWGAELAEAAADDRGV